MAVLVRRPQQPRPAAPKRQPTALPFNANIAAARRRLLEQRQNYLRDYGRERSDLNTNATNSLRSLDIQQPDVNRAILNNFAGRGMAYSSGYGTTLGDSAAQFEAQRSDINNQLGTNLSRLLSDKRATLTNYQYQLGNLNQRAAQEAQSQAGHLGYNRPPPKKKPPKRKKKATRLIANA